MEWNEFLVRFAFELSKILLPVIAGFLVALINAWRRKLLADLEASKPQLAWFLQEGAKMAVQAAEQAGAAELIEDKKQYALNALQMYLDNHGFEDFDIETLEAAIEAEVLKVNAGRLE